MPYTFKKNGATTCMKRISLTLFAPLRADADDYDKSGRIVGRIIRHLVPKERPQDERS